MRICDGAKGARFEEVDAENVRLVVLFGFHPMQTHTMCVWRMSGGGHCSLFKTIHHWLMIFLSTQTEIDWQVVQSYEQWKLQLKRNSLLSTNMCCKCIFHEENKYGSSSFQYKKVSIAPQHLTCCVPPASLWCFGIFHEPQICWLLFNLPYRYLPYIHLTRSSVVMLYSHSNMSEYIIDKFALHTVLNAFGWMLQTVSCSHFGMGWSVFFF